MSGWDCISIYPRSKMAAQIYFRIKRIKLTLGGNINVKLTVITMQTLLFHAFPNKTDLSVKGGL